VPVGDGNIVDNFSQAFVPYSIPRKDDAVPQDLNGLGSVTGVVYGDDGNPVGTGVDVVLNLASENRHTTTGAGGGFQFDGVKLGSVDVSSVISGVNTFAAGYLRQTGGSVRVDVNAPRCAVAGTLWSYNGEALGSSPLLFSGYLEGYGQIDSAPDGSFEFPNVKPDIGTLFSPYCYGTGCQDGYRIFNMGACPSGGGAIGYDLPLLRLPGRCSSGSGGYR